MADNPQPLVPEATTREIRRQLLHWYDEEHRPLPWRTSPSEYAIVVSEFMLQQTQVQTVVPYFEEFIKLFPDFARLAEASEQDVLRAWSGLGYYSRARLLKRAAELIVRRHGGSLPRDPEALRELPGFGDYTVGAVASIALGLPMALVDGNVRRVVGRLFAMKGRLASGAERRRLWAICGELVDPARPGDFNQALMELGATVCVTREPLCLVCPLFEHCRARAIGYPEAYPAPLRRPAREIVREVAVAYVREGKILLLQRGEGSSFAGLWELPRLDSRESLAEADLTPERVMFEVVRVKAQGGASAIGRAESIFTNHLIKTELYRIEDSEHPTIHRRRHVAHRWVAAKTLGKLPASRAQHKLFELLAEKKEGKKAAKSGAVGKS